LHFLYHPLNLDAATMLTGTMKAAATNRLPRSGFFESASDRIMKAFDALATDQKLSPGDILCEQGEDGDTLYLIEEGTLEVSVLSSDGRKLFLDVMHAGDYVGEIALLDPGERTATLSARTAVRLLCISRADLEMATRDDPDLGLELARMAAKRLRWVSQQLHEQVFLPLPARLARKLMHLTAEASPILRMSQNELADFVGATREAVSKTLKHWEQDDVIQIGRQKVIVQDFDALRTLSNIDLI
jgi:CRP-like cAMP-binding protein